jgi:hypothetical protein
MKYYTGNYRIVTTGDAERPYGAQLEKHDNMFGQWSDTAFTRKTVEEVKAWVGEYLAKEMHEPEILEECIATEQTIAPPDREAMQAKASADIININEIRGI